MKKIAILGAVTVLLGCSSATVADDDGSSFKIENSFYNTPSVIDVAVNTQIDVLSASQAIAKQMEQDKLEEARAYALAKNASAIDLQIDKLYGYIDKTRYVFSGSTPSGWDCSGLVFWFYGELGIEIPHSATKQGNLKPKVSVPMPGDIVVFKYNGAKSFIHSGIYIGDNKLIHAGFRSGMKTEIIGLDDPVFNDQTHYFIRLLETK